MSSKLAKTRTRKAEVAYEVTADTREELEGFYENIRDYSPSITFHRPRDGYEADWSLTAKIKCLVVIPETVVEELELREELIEIPEAVFDLVCHWARVDWLSDIRGEPQKPRRLTEGEEYTREELAANDWWFWSQTRQAELGRIILRSGEWLFGLDTEDEETFQELKTLERKIEKIDLGQRSRLKLTREAVDQYADRIKNRVTDDGLLLPRLVQAYLNGNTRTKLSLLKKHGDFLEHLLLQYAPDALIP